MGKAWRTQERMRTPKWADGSERFGTEGEVARPEVGLRWGCCSREGTWEQNEEGAFVPEGRDLCSHTLATLVCQLASVSLSQFPHLHIVRLWRGRLL